MDDERTERHYLDTAARLAMRAAGDVEPNPMVGAVIVKAGRVIGMGHHTKFGAPHAEREALADCARRGENPRGSTVYCTLEPCVHHGKQPPCCDALIEAGVSRVVYARPDPAGVSGGGHCVLSEAGIEAVHSTASVLAARLSDPFVHRIHTGLPWVIAKWAQTIDGRIATRTGESQWISGEGSRLRVHRLRARVDAILTGLGTVTADDPMLTARGVRRARKTARRVVIDRDLDITDDRALIRTANDTPTTIACHEDLLRARSPKSPERKRRASTPAPPPPPPPPAPAPPPARRSRSGLFPGGSLSPGETEARLARLESLGVEFLGVPGQDGATGRLRLDMLLRSLVDHYDATNVLVEAGPGLLGALFEEDLVCEAVVYVAPMLLGDAEAMAAATGRIAERLSDGRRFELCRVKRVGDDVELTYRRCIEDR